jgi:hypothetical protein
MNTQTQTQAAHTAAARGTVAANAGHVVLWVNTRYAKTGALAAPRWCSVAVGQTWGALRALPNGYTAADVLWGAQRGLHLAAAPGSALHTAWVAATAKGAPASAVKAWCTAANAALHAQAKAARANAKQLASLPAIVAAQPAGTRPVQANA